MKNLTTERIDLLELPVATAWLLGECMQARGMQELWIRQRPEALKALKEQAVVQSVESSNRIEGISIAADRLRPVVLGKARPRDRSEEELAGYRKALDWIFSRKRRVAFGPEVVLKLHALAQGGMSGDAGHWKAKDNEIIEILPNNERRVRFVPTSAADTPGAVQGLCDSFRVVRENEQVPILLTIAACVFDLLCIHPFRDGNGRVSRLVTTFLLIQEGLMSVASSAWRESLNSERVNTTTSWKSAPKNGTPEKMILRYGGASFYPCCEAHTVNWPKRLRGTLCRLPRAIWCAVSSTSRSGLLHFPRLPSRFQELACRWSKRSLRP